MSDAAVPTIRDRELVNEALNRAMQQFMLERRGDFMMKTHYSSEEVDEVLGPNSSLKKMVVEAEIAVATARVEERERCAKIAESIENWSMSPKEVAQKIRTAP